MFEKRVPLGTRQKKGEMNHMKLRTLLVLGVAALVVCCVVAAFLAPDLAGPGLRVLASTVALALGVTVTYAYPVAGGTAPTSKQAKRRNMLTATVIMADGETAAVVTHNWGLSNAELADLFPVVTWNYVTPGTSPALLSFSRATNAVTINKGTGTGSGGTFEVNLERPHTIIR